MNNEIRVALVEDDAVLALVIQECFSRAAGFGATAHYSSAVPALRNIPKHPIPHVALVDLRLPGLSGLECIRRLKEMGLPTKIIAFTSSDDPDTVVEVLRSGADGYLLKNRPVNELVHSIVSVCSGKTLLAEEIVEGIVKTFRRTPLKPLETLTRAEHNVLELTAEGLDCKEIAKRLNISVNTVYVHNKRILRKTGVGSRNAAAAILRRVNEEGPA